MVEKASQAASESSGPDVKGDQSSSEFKDLKKRVHDIPSRRRGREEYSITISNGRIYVNDELVLGSPEPEDFGPTDAGSWPSLQAPALRSERVAIGYSLQPQ